MKLPIRYLFLTLVASIFVVSWAYMSFRDIQNQPDLRAQSGYPTIPPPAPTWTYVPPPPGPGCSGLADGTSCDSCDKSALQAYGCATHQDGATGNCAAGYSSWCACSGGGCYPYETVNGCSTSWTNNAGCYASCPAGSTCLPHYSYCTPCNNDTNTCYTVNTTCTPSCGDTSQQCNGVKYYDSCGVLSCTGTGSGSCNYGSWSSCTPACGQAITRSANPSCGASGCTATSNGSCSTSSCGEPSAPQSCSPNNAQSSPAIIATSTETLNWTAPLSPHNYTEWTVNVSRVGVGTSTYHYTPTTYTMVTNPLVAGVLYNWTVNAYDQNNCSSVSGSTCTGTANDGIGPSLGGYFCYELTPGQVTINSPIGSQASPVTYPGAASVNLQWYNNEANHTFTNGYQIVVTNLSTGTSTAYNQASSVTSYTFTNPGAPGPYQWSIRPYNTYCDGVTTVYGPPSYGYFTFDNPPSLVALNIRNVTVGSTSVMGNGTTLYNDGNLVNTQTVAGQAGPVNQICQPEFTAQVGVGHTRDVSFRINLNDNDGRTDFSRVTLRLSSGSSTMTVYVNNVGAGWTSPGALSMGTSNVSADLAGQFTLYDGPVINSTTSNGMIVVIPIRFYQTFPQALYNLSISATDKYGLNLSGADANGYVDAGRDFKVWNCQVPVAGALYDASRYTDTQILFCDPGIYDPANNNQYNRVPNLFDSLSYNNASVGVSMTVTKPYSYNSSNPPGHLVWGYAYNPAFNPELYNDIPGANQHMLATDVNIGTTTCSRGSGTLDIGASTTSGGAATFLVNPYATNPTLQVNFAGIRNQLQWYQVTGGGALANGDVEYGVPATCPNTLGCTPAVSITNGKADGITMVQSGLVAGLNPTDINGCDTSVCFYGYPNPSRNWFTNTPLVQSFNYSRIKGQVFDTDGIGVTAVGGPSLNWSNLMASVGSTGVIFIDGDVTINANTVTPSYLVVVVNGNISVDSSVTNLDGAYIATQTFAAAGSNVSQLVINGLVYAGSTVSLTRTQPGSANNGTPSVLVNYEPKYLFLMPQEVFYGLTDWTGY